eukprot:CAMPEP_0167791876 /NCGR_PEP_ID=MMETSP0111_2-20121227/12212_1 /TAXON_ID=91324 /ORGANISM="Lotharella globosa, Strain CCCM811" /LENGTH=347 /DNA_ID=CAMNT_0007684659 /DNA_START=54 /DNA_END=1097 /DNA_ORIENTATION=-
MTKLLYASSWIIGLAAASSSLGRTLSLPRRSTIGLNPKPYTNRAQHSIVTAQQRQRLVDHPNHQPKVFRPTGQLRQRDSHNRLSAGKTNTEKAISLLPRALPKKTLTTALAALGLSLAAPGAMMAAGAFPALPAAPAALMNGGFFQALSLVFASEIGDKTFFIAALLAMRSSRLLAFSGSMLALATMTIISVLIGQVFHNVPASLTGGLPLDDYAAIAFLGYFGVKSILDAYNLPDESSGVDEELEEAEKEVSGAKGDTQLQLIIEAFTLVFTAELGDRSFLATIALSAAQNPVMVGAGAILAHSLATGIAVASGALLAKYISEKVVGYIGGVLFLAFAVTTAVGVF